MEPATPSTTSRVLVLEDNDAQRRTILALLRDEGYEALGCSTGAEALRCLRSQRVEVIVADLRLPDIRETDLLKELRAFSEEIPIVINTGYGSFETARDSVNLGVFAYVEKAGDPAELMSQVHRAVHQRLRSRAQALEAAVAERTQQLGRANEALRESEERFRGFTELSPVGIYVTDAKGDCVYANPRWCQMAGLTREEATGRGWCRAIHPADRERIVTEWYRMPRGPAAWAHEYRFLCPDGNETWVYGTAVPLYDEQGAVTGYLGANVDITERKRLEGQLHQAQRLESLGSLAGGVAHEINNPINGIMNYAQLISDQPDDADSAAQYAREIIAETNRVAAIVRSLLQFSRREGPPRQPVETGRIIDGVLSLFRTVIKHDQIQLSVRVDSGLPPIACQEQQIQQVLINLLTNARDALNERYPSYDVDKRVCVTARAVDSPAGARVRLTVEDSGGGIPASAQERIFDPFFTTKCPGRGTGLGLSIAHTIVRDHGGELSVETSEGQYTRFHVDLPPADAP